MKSNDIEITTIGPGNKSGESIVINLGDNKWIIIDSCTSLNGEVLPLKYLQDNTISFDNVVCIICTHWHQDHYSSISKVLDQCKNAKFCIAPIGNNKSFLKYVFSINRINPTTNTAWTEFEKCLNIISNRGDRPIYCNKDRTIETSTIAKLESVCPSDDAIDDFNSLLLKIDDSDLSTIPSGAKSLDDNLVSLAFILSFYDQSVLIGGDLETNRSEDNDYNCETECDKLSKYGWCDVYKHSITFRDKGCFNVVKLPHHSSVTGYCPLIAKTHFASGCIGTTTIHKSPDLPKKEMIDLYSQHLSKYYTTYDLSSSTKTEPEIKPLNEGNTDVEVVTYDTNIGIITCRWNFGKRKWETEIKGTAISLK